MNIRLLSLLIILNSTAFAQLHTYNWSNGNKKAEGIIKEGLEQGKWSFWSKDGVVQQEVTYKDGEFDGQYINYNDKGEKKEEGFRKTSHFSQKLFSTKVQFRSSPNQSSG